jgi:DNA/RNA endonuclease G (NUC1)
VARSPETNEWYAKPFDHGHLVGRLDSAWGRTKSIAKTANVDTFHFTDCSPQHSKLNADSTMSARTGAD